MKYLYKWNMKWRYDKYYKIVWKRKMKIMKYYLINEWINKIMKINK